MAVYDTLSLVKSTSFPNAATLLSGAMVGLVSSGGDRESVTDRPSAFQPQGDYGVSESRYSRPFRDSSGFVLKCEKAIGAAVLHLLKRGGPTTVFRAIIAVIVDTIKCHPFGPFAHILDEVFICPPTITHLDSPSSISVVVRVVGVCASLNHRNPSSMQGVANQCPCRANVGLVAPAGAGRPARKGVASNISHRSAVAPTMPDSVLASGSGSRDYRPSIEPLTSQISELWHSLILSQSPVFMGVKS